MKKIACIALLVLLNACSSDDDANISEENIILEVSHYKTTSLLFGSALIVEEQGNGRLVELPDVRGFNFEQAHNYRLNTRKVTTQNPGSTARVVHYELITELNKETIPPNTSFTIPLADFVNGVGYVSWLTETADQSYLINREIILDCNQFCSELDTRLGLKDTIIGEFTHGTDGSYVLIGLQ